MDDQRSTPERSSRHGIPSGTFVAGGFILLLILIGIVAGMFRSGTLSMPGMDMNSGAAGMAPTASGATEGTMDMPGMDMGSEEMSGMDMRPVDVTDAPVADSEARGNQPLEPTIAEDGTKEFELMAGVVRWNILPDVEIGAFAYNDQVSGPEIRVTQGDAVRIHFTNTLPEATSIHWHGLILPNEMDGASDVTQDPIEPGETFVYEFTVEQAGTYFYHTHKSVDRQQALGLYGALISEPKVWATEKPFDQEYTLVLGEWKIDDQGQTLPAMNQAGAFPNFFTINGKSYPETETIMATVGDRIRFRFVGSGQFIHPMHIHGGPFEIVETDGNLVPEGARLTKDTVLVGPGERYDVEWTALQLGRWLIHCHINDHVTNNGVEVEGGGGLTMIVEVTL
jgi:FtsP/CotA-like multicopper oxidase with cupredoxin domain